MINDYTLAISVDLVARGKHMKNPRLESNGARGWELCALPWCP